MAIDEDEFNGRIATLDYESHGFEHASIPAAE